MILHIDYQNMVNSKPYCYWNESGVLPSDVSNRSNCLVSLQASATAKKYKFVVTGHGKYEKIAVDDHMANGKSGEITDVYDLFLLLGSLHEGKSGIDQV